MTCVSCAQDNGWLSRRCESSSMRPAAVPAAAPSPFFPCMHTLYCMHAHRTQTKIRRAWNVAVQLPL